jgi:DnaJ domain
MAGDLRAGGESTRQRSAPSTPTDDDVGHAIDDVGAGGAARLRLCFDRISHGSSALSPLDPMPPFDLYAELDVPPDADAGVIERAWRDGVRSVHPDRARSGEERAATVRTARLNVAREWLMDPSKRARYDLLRLPGLKAEIPTVDPLGSWPARPRRRASTAVPILLLKSLVVPGLVVVVALLIGPGSNALAAAAVVMGVLTFVAAALYAVVWLLVGAVYRRLGS